ncbi:hypothetical protein D3C76_28160 [compost metagenome]
MALQMMLFHQGEQHVIDVRNIEETEEIFFMSKKITLSMEELRTGQKVIYGDWGQRLEDDTPVEAMVIVGPDVTCEKALKLLREEIERRLVER